MKYQGKDGKYYTIQLASLTITFFISLLLKGFSNLFFELPKEKYFFYPLFLWAFLFILHYTWFLTINKKKTIIHYKVFKRIIFCFLFFVFIIIPMLFIYGDYINNKL